MIFSLRIVCIFFFIIANAPEGAKASTCIEKTHLTIFHSCELPANIQLEFTPLNFKRLDKSLLTITGAYSSGDRFNVEGLALDKGRIVSRRVQQWDGVLLLYPNGDPAIYRSEYIPLENQVYNLKDLSSRHSFLRLAKKLKLSLIQSHLLISYGRLDIHPVDNAQRFIRRMFFIDDLGWGIYESKTALTLYDAAHDILKNLNPKMVLNLDMGAYNYCQYDRGMGMVECGNLFVEPQKLTNLIHILPRVLAQEN